MTAKQDSVHLHYFLKLAAFDRELDMNDRAWAELARIARATDQHSLANTFDRFSHDGKGPWLRQERFGYGSLDVTQRVRF